MGIKFEIGPTWVGNVPGVGNAILSKSLRIRGRAARAVLLYGCAACGKSTVASRLPNVVSSDQVRRSCGVTAGDNSVWPRVHAACRWLLNEHGFFVLDATNLGPKQTAEFVSTVGGKFIFVVPEPVLYHATLTALRSLRGDAGAEYYSRTERFMRETAVQTLTQAESVYAADSEGELWEVSPAGFAGSISETGTIDEFEDIVRWCYKDTAGRLAKPFGWPKP